MKPAQILYKLRNCAKYFDDDKEMIEALKYAVDLIESQVDQQRLSVNAEKKPIIATDKDGRRKAVFRSRWKHNPPGT